MPEFLKELIDKIKEDDNKILLVSLVLLLLPVIFFISIHMKTTSSRGKSKIEMQGLSKQSAFNLTAKTSLPSRKSATGAHGSGGSGGSSSVSGGHSSSSAGSSYSSSSGSGGAGAQGSRYQGKGMDTRSKGLGVKPNIEKIEEQLENIMARINKTPRERKYPANATPELRQILDAEHDETYLAAISALDSSDRKLAEKLFKDVIANSGGNKFKEIYAWGGLMEIYQIEEEKAKFKGAFESYARIAQELKDFYGPLADSIASAYQLFEQMERLDPGVMKQALTRYNLENKSNLRYEDIMGALKETKSWYPENLQMSSELSAKLKKEGGS
jgi:hypothetical protein